MAATPSADTPKKNRWRMSALLLVLLSISGAGLLSWHMLKGPQDSPPAAPIFMALEPFTVNLQPGSAQRHLHVVISVRVQDAATQAQLTQYLPEVRSRVLNVLSNREGQALMEPSARDALAEDLEQALQRPYMPQQPGGHIASVVFTTFLLQ